MKPVMLFLSLLAMAASAAMAGAAENSPVSKTENKPYTKVLFDHDRHGIRKYPSNCRACHHDGQTDRSCSSAGCHQGRDGTRTFHNLCIGCHQNYKAKAPMTCAGCHTIE